MRVKRVKGFTTAKKRIIIEKLFSLRRLQHMQEYVEGDNIDSSKYFESEKKQEDKAVDYIISNALSDNDFSELIDNLDFDSKTLITDLDVLLEDFIRDHEDYFPDKIAEGDYIYLEPAEIRDLITESN